MKPRVEVVALEVNTKYTDVINLINKHGYSRIPVYEKTFDNIRGILFVKDLLPYLDKDDEFKWQKLIRKPYFVYEGKKINELLQDFKKKKVHIGIVVDEYGGVLGIVTLEDILEEIVGEINDEFDKESLGYSELDNGKYEFEGNVLLQDFIKLFELDNNYFSDTYPEVDTLAGLLLELKQEFPEKGEVLEYKDFRFTVLEISERKIEKIVVEKIKKGDEK
jgi:CBS domain containing-hemolysin-like protein